MYWDYYKKYTKEERERDERLCDFLMKALIVVTGLCLVIELVKPLLIH